MGEEQLGERVGCAYRFIFHFYRQKCRAAAEIDIDNKSQTVYKQSRCEVDVKINTTQTMSGSPSTAKKLVKLRTSIDSLLSRHPQETQRELYNALWIQLGEADREADRELLSCFQENVTAFAAPAEGGTAVPIVHEELSDDEKNQRFAENDEQAPSEEGTAPAEGGTAPAEEGTAPAEEGVLRMQSCRIRD